MNVQRLQKAIDILLQAAEKEADRYVSNTDYGYVLSGKILAYKDLLALLEYTRIIDHDEMINQLYRRETSEREAQAANTGTTDGKSSEGTEAKS